MAELLDLLHATVVKGHRQTGARDAFLAEQAQLIMMSCALALTPQVWMK